MKMLLRLITAMLVVVFFMPTTRAQTVAPTYLSGNKVATAGAILVIDKTGNPLGTSTNPIITSGTVTISSSVSIATLPALPAGTNSIGSVTATPLYSTPTAYTSGTVFNALAFGSVTLTCTVAPTAGSVSISPDNASGYVGQTVELNNASGISTTAAITAAGVYTISGHQYVKITLTGGTCFIAGGQ